MSGEPIFEHMLHELSSHVPHYHHGAPGAVTTPGKAAATMNLIEIADRWKADAEAEIAKAKEKIEQDLPVVAQIAQAAASNPLVDAALSVVHLSPEFLQSLATLVTDAEAKLVAEKQAADEAAAAQQAALDAAQPPAEPEAPAA